MVGIPTAKSFCGCCALRVPCIVLASIRMIAYIAGVLAFLYFFVFLDGVFKEKQNRTFKEDQLDIVLRILFFVLSINTCVSIIFILGVKSKNAAKMQYYLLTVGLNILLFVSLFKVILAVCAAIDCIILFYSYSLYKEYSIEDSTMNGVVYSTVNTTVTNENDPSSTSTKENRL